MSDAAGSAGRVVNTNGLVDRANACPKKSYDELCVKVEAPRCSDRLHDANSRFEGINSKSEK